MIEGRAPREHCGAPAAVQGWKGVGCRISVQPKPNPTSVKEGTLKGQKRVEESLSVTREL